MTTILIANVGNRDVKVSRSAPLPLEVNPNHDPNVSRRALGEYLQAHWDDCRAHLSLPIVGKAVAYARQQAGALDRIVLVASDQGGCAGVADHHLQQDTCALAPVVARLLDEQYGAPPAATAIWTVTGNPSDYGVMQAFFRARLSALREERPDGVFYLEVSGGTPAMTSMLLTTAAEVFGLAARPLYVSEHAEQPYPLDLGRRLVADALVRAVRADVELYAYHAAAQTARDNRDLLGEFVPLEPLLAVLEYAYQRLNFSFADAWAALDGIVDPTWRERACATASGLHAPTRAWVLRESVYNAEVAYRLGRLFDFATRVFQFAEGAWRLLALELGVEFVDESGAPNEDGGSISPNWQRQYPDLVDHLRERGIDVGRGANRRVLTGIVTELCTQRGDASREAALENLGALERVGDLRNRVIHRCHPITLELLWETYYPGKKDRKRHKPEQTPAEIVQAMQSAWSAIAQQPFGDVNPYTAINRLIGDNLAL